MSRKDHMKESIRERKYRYFVMILVLVIGVATVGLASVYAHNSVNNIHTGADQFDKSHQDNHIQTNGSGISDKNNKLYLDNQEIEIKTQDPSSVKIGSMLEENQGTNSEVIVNFGNYEDDLSVKEMKRKSDIDQSNIIRLANQTDSIEVKNTFWLTNSVVVKINSNRVNLETLSKVKGVESMISNVEFETLDIDNPREPTTKNTEARRNIKNQNYDVTYDVEYGVEYVDAPDVWSDYDTMGSNTSVAVLDTGVDPDHPDINLSRWAEFDSSGNQINTSPQDYGTHGTHVSGIVSGGNASGQYIGVAPKTQLYHGAVLTNCNDRCTGYLTQVIGGMEWAVENDVDVISMSLGVNGYETQFINPVQSAESAGAIVIAGSGNGGVSTSTSPGNVYESTAVGAVGASYDVQSFSSGEIVNTSDDWRIFAPSDWPDQFVVPTVTAPGSWIYSSVPEGNYTLKSGTSMATPFVSGTVALIESAVDEELSPKNIESVLEATATKPNHIEEDENRPDNRYGYGMINASAAVVETRRTLSQTTDSKFSVDNTKNKYNTIENVAFNATNTTGNIRKYMWDFNGDGEYEVSSNNKMINYSFDNPGERTVSLKVIDYLGRSSVHNKSMSVDLPVVSQDNPKDPDNDGLYEDIRADGELNILDIQALFNNINTPEIQSNSEYFNFSSIDESKNEVTIFDISALWEEYAGS